MSNPFNIPANGIAWISVPVNLAKNPNLKPEEKAILLAIACRPGLFLSLIDLEIDSGVSRHSMNKWKNRLKLQGVISWAPGNSRRKTNQYTIHPSSQWNLIPISQKKRRGGFAGKAQNQSTTCTATSAPGGTPIIKASNTISIASYSNKNNPVSVPSGLSRPSAFKKPLGSKQASVAEKNPSGNSSPPPAPSSSEDLVQQILQAKPVMALTWKHREHLPKFKLGLLDGFKNTVENWGAHSEEAQEELKRLVIDGFGVFVDLEKDILPELAQDGPGPGLLAYYKSCYRNLLNGPEKYEVRRLVSTDATKQLISNSGEFNNYSSLVSDSKF